MEEEEPTDRCAVCCYAAATFLTTLVFLRITIAAIIYAAGLYRFLNTWSYIFFINQDEGLLMEETHTNNDIQKALVSRIFSERQKDNGYESCPICLGAFRK